MARMRRLKIKNSVAYYHIVSRTVGQEFFFNEIEKEKMVSIIQQFSSLYFVKVLGYCIMSNHFHLLIKSKTIELYTQAEVAKRVQRYRKREVIDKEEFSLITDRLGDISEYVRAIKQTFSRWYNKLNNRTGYLWGDRFKSVLLESGQSLLHCLTYIDLNPVRAGIVTKPEEYRWCSYSYRIYAKNAGNFLSFNGIFDRLKGFELEKKKLHTHSLMVLYRKILYEAGAIEINERKATISAQVIEMEKEMGFTIPQGKLFLNRVRYFSDGLALGSKAFIQEVYSQYSGNVILKKSRKAHFVGFDKAIVSVRNLGPSLP